MPLALVPTTNISRSLAPDGRGTGKSSVSIKDRKRAQSGPIPTSEESAMRLSSAARFSSSAKNESLSFKLKCLMFVPSRSRQMDVFREEMAADKVSFLLTLEAEHCPDVLASRRVDLTLA
jgi:hypothetical protein